MRALRLALSRFAAEPGFASFAIVTLAVGIGAATAVYSVAYAVFYQPLAIRDAHEVVNVYHSDPRKTTAARDIALSWPDFQTISARQTAFTDLIAWSSFLQPLANTGDLRLVSGELVSGNYFSFVGIQSLLGRTIQLPDDRMDAAAVIVIGERIWRERFSADPNIVGQSLRLGEHSFEVVGVIPAHFRGVRAPTLMPTDVWVPLATAPTVGTIPSAAARQDSERRWLLIKGRLRQGETLDSAQAQVTAIGRALDQVTPIGNAVRRASRKADSVRQFCVLRAADIRAHESVDAFAVPLSSGVLAATWLVLLMVCVNLANFQLARAARRGHEVAIRAALGASRRRLVLETFYESALVTIVGGLLGVGFAWCLNRLLTVGISLTRGVILSIEPQLEPAVLLGAVAACLVSVTIFGLVPAWFGTRVQLRGLLDLRTGGAVPKWRGRRLLIAIQIAASVALLAVGSVFLQRVLTKLSHNPGFDLDRLVAIEMDFRFRGYSHDEAATAVEAILAKARRELGTGAVAAVSRLPVHFTDAAGFAIGTTPVSPKALESPSSARNFAAGIFGTPDLFQVLGIRLVTGRPFDIHEAATDASVIVIDRATATAVFGTTAVEGRTVFLGDDAYSVVGVADDVDFPTLGSRAVHVIYLPGVIGALRSTVIVARVNREEDSALVKLRSLIRTVDPDLPVTEAVTGREIQEQRLLFDWIGATSGALLGLFTLILALIGLVGLLVSFVMARRREIALRSALGAEPRRVIMLVVRDGLRPVWWGAVIGIIGGVWLALMLTRFAYGVGLVPWYGLAGATVLLVFAAAVATYVPARRAAEIEPNVVLKEL